MKTHLGGISLSGQSTRIDTLSLYIRCWWCDLSHTDSTLTETFKLRTTNGKTRHYI